METPTTNGDNGKKAPECSEFGNLSEGLSVVDTFMLIKPLCNKKGFVVFNSAIRIVLNLEYPFAANGMVAQRERYDGPSIISLKCGDFGFLGFDPFGVLTSLVICLWLD